MATWNQPPAESTVFPTPGIYGDITAAAKEVMWLFSFVRLPVSLLVSRITQKMMGGFAGKLLSKIVLRGFGNPAFTPNARRMSDEITYKVSAMMRVDAKFRVTHTAHHEQDAKFVLFTSRIFIKYSRDAISQLLPGSFRCHWHLCPIDNGRCDKQQMIQRA